MRKPRIKVQLDPQTEARLRAESARSGSTVTDLVRRAVSAYLDPDSATVATADPVLQAISDGIRREARSRELPPETIVHLWFQMMRPAPPIPDPGLRTNKDLEPEPRIPECPDCDSPRHVIRRGRLFECTACAKTFEGAS
jgi:Ribbon-helix-helix protein, copG family